MLFHIRTVLNKLPSTFRVALWLAVSAAISAVLNGIQDGKIEVDPGYAMLINWFLVTLRSTLDGINPTLTGKAMST